MKLKTTEMTLGAGADALTFKTTTFPAMLSCELLADLISAVGPAFLALMQLAPDTQLDAVGPDLLNALKTLKGREVVALFPRVLASTTVVVPDATGGRQITLNTKESIDTVFTGSLLDLFKTLAFAARANFASFSPGNAQNATSLPALKGV